MLQSWKFEPVAFNMALTWMHTESPQPGISIHTRAYNSDENGHVVPQRLNHAVGHSHSFLYTRWLILPHT